MILPWMVGSKAAKEIILTGADRISADRARETGMINRMVPTAELDAAACGDRSQPRRADQARDRPRARGPGHARRTGKAAPAIDLAIGAEGSPHKAGFMELVRRHGLKSALAWRDARLACPSWSIVRRLVAPPGAYGCAVRRPSGQSAPSAVLGLSRA
jgi:enoyl-CoA hydratase